MEINSLKENASFGKIRRSIITSFALTFIFAILLAIGINLTTNLREYESSIINLAGRQRMLSQKIAKNIFYLQTSEQNHIEISEDVALWSAVHMGFQNGNEALNIPKIENKTVDSILRAISPYQENIQLISKQLNLANLSKAELRELSIWERKYLAGMDQMVEALQLHIDNTIGNLTYVLGTLTFLFLIFIWLLYHFFIKPIIDSVGVLSKNMESQSRHLASILENTSDRIWTVDKNYMLIAYNSVFAKGRLDDGGIAPIKGENVLEAGYFLENKSKTKDYYDRVLSGTSFLTEVEIEKEGRKIFYELSFNPIIDDHGLIIGCSVYQRDITMRISAMEELKESESSLKEAQRIANIGNWEWDIKNNEIKWSDQLYSIYGKDQKTFTPTYETFLELIHPEDREIFDKNVCHNLENHEDPDISHRIILEDGNLRHVHQKGKLFFDKNNTVVRMAGTTQDITIMENARERILQQYRELQNFVYIISHNIRGPISTLLSLIDLLEHNDNRDHKDIIMLMGNTVKKLDGTIKDLNHSLTLKNIATIDFEQVDLKGVMEDILILISDEIDKYHATIEFDFAKAPTAFGMKRYYSNIFYHLILNSIKHRSPERDPHIVIYSNTTPIGGIQIVLSDNGKGMELNEERRKKIFNMYGKLSGSTQGKGLGLYLVKTQVETMNGSIEVESKNGEGSIFTINLLLNAMEKKLITH